MRTRRYLESVRRALPENAQASLDLAFANDALAARCLMIAAPRRLHGHIACLAYQLGVANPAYREIVKTVWARESRDLLTGFWPGHMVRRMLARAEFQVPEFSGPVAIFRPVCRASSKKEAAGLCWSTSRERAASVAAGSGAARPRILRASISPADIIYWDDIRGEQEVVPRGRVVAAIVERVRFPPEKGGRRISH